MAQSGFEIKKQMVIDVSADQLWELIGPGFVDVYKWSSNVDHAEGSGTPEFDGAVCSKRSCDVNVKGFSSINEDLFLYDQDKMSLGYAVVEGMPGFITKAQNVWTVKKVNESQSILTMAAEFESKGMMGALTRGMMKKKMAETLDTVLLDAKIYAETGQISSAKQERVAELERKSKKKVA